MNGFRDDHFPFVTTESWESAALRDHLIDSHPPVPYSRHDHQLARDGNRQMSQFHRSLFDVVPSLGVTRHHMLSRHRHPHLARYREMFGSGHEPYIGWECFMELFLETHGLLSDETVHPLDRELSENLTDLPNVPPSARLGYRLRINGISEFEVEFQEFILTRHRRRGEGSDPDYIEQMPYGPINFRHMPLNRLLRLFRELRQCTTE